jgi:hypothetical protein
MINLALWVTVCVSAVPATWNGWSPNGGLLGIERVSIEGLPGVKRYTTLVLATRADITGITGMGIAAGHKASNDLSNVSTLIWGDFVFQAQVTPAVPVVAEDLSKTVVGSGMMRINYIRGLLPRR